MNRTLVIKGIVYEDIEKASTDYNLSPLIVGKQLGSGVPPHKVFGLTNPADCFYKHVDVGGFTGVDVESLCKDLDLSFNVVLLRLSSGSSPDEVFGLISRKEVEQTGNRTVYIGFRGEEFEDLRDLADMLGVSLKTLWKTSIQQGSLSKACVKIKPSNKPYYRGVWYENLHELAHDYNMLARDLKELLREGYSISGVLDGKEKREKRGSIKTVTFNGITFKGLNELMRYYGINNNTFRRRINNGESLEDAVKAELSYPVLYMNPVEVNGVRYETAKHACRVLGVSFAKVQHNLRYGKTIDEAFKPDIFVIGGVTYYSVRSAARDYGLCNFLVQNRISNGWTLDEAFGLAERKTNRKPRTGVKIKYNGVEYSSIKVICDHYNVSVGSFREFCKRRGVETKDGFGLFMESRKK